MRVTLTSIVALMVQVRVLFEYCRIDEDWENAKAQQMFEAAVKQLKEVLKREKIKQNIKEEEHDRLVAARGEIPLSDALAANIPGEPQDRPADTMQLDRERKEQAAEGEKGRRGEEKGMEEEGEGKDDRGRGDGWQEMSYLWGMILYEWGMRKLYVDSNAAGLGAASSSSPAVSPESSPFLDSVYGNDTELPQAIQKMFEEAEGWLVRAIKGDSQHSLPSISSSVYKRVEKVHPPPMSIPRTTARRSR
jgi:hypothetical protein